MVSSSLGSPPQACELSWESWDKSATYGLDAEQVVEFGLGHGGKGRGVRVGVMGLGSRVCGEVQRAGGQAGGWRGELEKRRV